jgi:hypothetical protein
VIAPLITNWLIVSVAVLLVPAITAATDWFVYCVVMLSSPLNVTLLIEIVSVPIACAMKMPIAVPFLTIATKLAVIVTFYMVAPALG